MSSTRSVLRAVVTGVTVGAVALGSAWAGASFTAPPATGDAAAELAEGGALVTALDADATGGALARAVEVEEIVAVEDGARLPDGWFTAGTAVRTLVPPEEQWVQGEDCEGIEQFYTPLTPEGCLITFDMRWADGVDEANPIEVRAVAIGNGVDTVVFSLMDVVGYMAAYPADVCATCGIDAITAEVEAATGVPSQNIVLASSHTHASPSTIAAGPAWYYEFVRDQAIDALTAAIEAQQPVRIETGATPAKPFNVDRRIVNRAVPDYELAWLRAFVPASEDGPERTVATLGNFAVHPTVRTSNAQLHSGLVGPFVHRLEEAFPDSTGLFFPGGLGDQTVDRSYGVNGLGIGLADLIVEDIERGGELLGSNDIEVARTTVQIPVENQIFLGLLASGYAVREFAPPYGGGPHVATVQAKGANRPVCEGAGALHVVGPVSAVRLGERPAGGKQELGEEYRLPVESDNVVLVQAPGEIFASISGTVKDYLSRSDNVLVMGMSNDTLGYMIPANQYDLTGSQGLGLANNATDLGQYEEALSLGRCTGEIVMNAMLEMGAQLGVMGEGEGP